MLGRRLQADTQSQQVADLRPRPAPLFPVTHAHASSQPLITTLDVEEVGSDRRRRTDGLRCHVPARLGPLRLLCSFCPSPRIFALRLAASRSARLVQAGRRMRLQTALSPFRQVLAALPLPSASGYHEVTSVLPQETFAPSHRAHAGRTPCGTEDAAR